MTIIGTACTNQLNIWREHVIPNFSETEAGVCKMRLGSAKEIGTRHFTLFYPSSHPYSSVTKLSFKIRYKFNKAVQK